MHALLLTALLAATPDATPPVSTRAADATVSAAFALPSKDGSAASTSRGTSALTYAIPLGLLALLGAGAAFAARRKATVPRHLHVVESASLGPKRGLALVDVGGERLLLAASESGVTLLRVVSIEPATSLVPYAGEERLPVASGRASPFEALLADSAEDQELREKLAAGFRART